MQRALLHHTESSLQLGIHVHWMQSAESNWKEAVAAKGRTFTLPMRSRQPGTAIHSSTAQGEVLSDEQRRRQRRLHIVFRDLHARGCAVGARLNVRSTSGCLLQQQHKPDSPRADGSCPRRNSVSPTASACSVPENSAEIQPVAVVAPRPDCFSAANPAPPDNVHHCAAGST